MSTVWKKVFHCDECGHEWIAEGEQKPGRCPSRGCRKRSWDKDGAANAAKPVAKAIAATIPGVQTAASLPAPRHYDRPEHLRGCKCGMCRIQFGPDGHD